MKNFIWGFFNKVASLVKSKEQEDLNLSDQILQNNGQQNKEEKKIEIINNLPDQILQNNDQKNKEDEKIGIINNNQVILSNNKIEEEAKIDQAKLQNSQQYTGKSILNISTVKPSQQLFKVTQQPKENLEFKKLSQQQLINLLNQQPKLYSLKSSQGQFIAFDSINIIHQEGLVSRLGQNSSANKELMWAMQYICFMINEEKDEKKRKEALLDLARCTEDCVPVTQRMITTLARKYQGFDDFPQSVQAFIDDLKDKAVDQAIYTVFPQMMDPKYGPQNHHRQYMQFPHVKSGFIKIFGNKFGISQVGAQTDPNANKDLGKHFTKFEQSFNKNFNICDVIKNFIQDVNNKEELQIAKNAFMKWAGEHQIMNIFFDETINYPNYYPDRDQITEQQEMMMAPFITEEIALQIFRVLKYIE